MLTVHERFTAREVISALHAVVLAHAKAGVRFGGAHDPREAHLQAPLLPSLPLKPESA